MPSIPAETLIDRSNQSLPLYMEVGREREGDGGREREREGERERGRDHDIESQDPVMVEPSQPLGYPTYMNQYISFLLELV